MLKATTELIHHLNLESKQRNQATIKSLLDCILKIGKKEDATVLLESYLNNYSDIDYGDLLKLFKKLGDDSFAEKIYQTVIINDRLLEGVEAEVLEVLGYFKYEPVKNLLFQYGFSKIETDYYLQRSAVLGLLNFDCAEYIEDIELAIVDCYNKNLFPEFIPALVSKLPNRCNYLEKLYELGNDYASTDCNSGIIMGFALCGNEGKQYFKKALFNPNWETYSTGTGTLYHSYQALKTLDISFKELYVDIKVIADDGHLKYHLSVLFALFEKRVSDYDDDKMETFRSLNDIFFSWENSSHSNNLIDLAERVGEEKEAYRFKNLFKLKMREELILQNLKNE